MNDKLINYEKCADCNHERLFHMDESCTYDLGKLTNCKCNGFVHPSDVLSDPI